MQQFDRAFKAGLKDDATSALGTTKPRKSSRIL